MVKLKKVGRFWVLKTPQGVVTYEPFREVESGCITLHWNTTMWEGHFRHSSCQFLDGKRCYCDGTAMGPYLTDKTDIYEELKRWAEMHGGEVE